MVSTHRVPSAIDKQTATLFPFHNSPHSISAAVAAQAKVANSVNTHIYIHTHTAPQSDKPHSLCRYRSSISMDN
jgi:hypothetical protein